jgi:phosphatidylglycerol:prolipoprotein diacylglycerol transferase
MITPRMTFPVTIGVGSWAVHPHLLFEASAYFVAFRVYLAMRRRRGDVIEDAPRWSIVTAAAIGAVVGSRVLFWLEDPSLTAAHLTDAAFLIGGKTIVGGLLGGWIAVEIAKRFLGIRGATGDLFAAPLAVGIAIGRIGCFLTGLEDRTYGVASSLPWAVDFGDGIRRHPTALYESVFMLAVAVALTRWSRSAHRGDLFKAFMASYLAFRLLVDAIKPEVRVALGLSSIQWACVAGLAYYLWWFIRMWRGHPSIEERVARA